MPSKTVSFSPHIKIPHDAINRHSEERHRKEENQPRIKVHPQNQNPSAIPRKQSIDSRNAIEIVNYKKQKKLEMKTSI